MGVASPRSVCEAILPRVTMTFGEMALLGHTRRTATVHADTDAECWVLEARAFDTLAVDFPRLKIVLLENLSENLAWRLHQANQLIGTLASGMLGDWFLPFVYNVGLAGMRSSILFWVFLGGLLALQQSSNEMSRE